MTTPSREAMSPEKAIRVFDESAKRTRPNTQTEAWAVLKAHLDALAQRVAEMEFESRQGWALAKGYQREMEKAEARAERLAEALRKAEEYIDDVTPTWASGGQGVLAIIRAALNPAAAQEKNDA